MKRSSDPTEREETILGYMISGGIVLILLGFGVTALLYLAGMSRMFYTAQQGAPDASTLFFRFIGPVIIIIGILTALTGLIIGLIKSKQLTSRDHQVHVDDGARVLGRFAFSQGQELYEEYQWEVVSDAEFYVKIEHSNRTIREYRCDRMVFLKCADGMPGTTHTDGKWLGNFEPKVGGHPMPVDIFTDREGRR